MKDGIILHMELLMKLNDNRDLLDQTEYEILDNALFIHYYINPRENLLKNMLKLEKEINDAIDPNNKKKKFDISDIVITITGI